MENSSAIKVLRKELKSCDYVTPYTKALEKACLALEKIEAITKFVNRDKVAQEEYFYIKMILEKDIVSDAIIKKKKKRCFENGL